MALWKDPSVKDSATPDAAGATADAVDAPAHAPWLSVAGEPARRASGAPARESLIAADVTIEGKIEGAGDVRIAGRFKGDVNVQGNVTVEPGASVNGQVIAATVIVSGTVEGNISASARVELLETGVISGDVKAAVLTVAAGSKMKGQADFGWGESGAGRG